MKRPNHVKQVIKLKLTMTKGDCWSQVVYELLSKISFYENYESLSLALFLRKFDLLSPFQ